MLSPSAYIPKRKPRAKQAEALARMHGQRVFALFMAQRTGKTKVTLDDWAQLAMDGKVKDLLVIAPAGAYRTWETGIQDDLTLPATIYTWISDAPKKHKDLAKKFLQLTGKFDDPRILLMNVEALSTVKTARELCLEFCQQNNVMVVIDESVCVKNPKAKRTQFINNFLAPVANWRRILSGLPTPRSPLDLFSQFWFLNPHILGHKSFTSFRDRYAIVHKVVMPGRKWPVPIIRGFRNTEQLQEKIAPFVFRARLEDCYDLPESTYMIRDVPLTEEQKRVYAALKKFATAELANGAHVTAAQVITQILRLHQVLCGHTKDERGVEQVIPEYRTRELIQLLEDHDGKAIIWCSYDADVRKVSEALAKNFECKVARFWGGNRDTREEEEKSFKTDPNCLFMVATAAAGGRGRTWDVADLVVYYSNSPDLDHRMQSEERAKNVGKTVPVAYVDLVARGTVDEKILKALRAKINLASAVTGDNWRSWVV